VFVRWSGFVVVLGPWRALDYEEVAQFCQKVLECKGTTLFTGVGKSAFIAKKVCQTLVSTGTRSIWLAPVVRPLS
jgi:arabinose-5-phosphate isomerase